MKNKFKWSTLVVGGTDFSGVPRCRVCQSKTLICKLCKKEFNNPFRSFQCNGKKHICHICDPLKK